MIDTTRLDAVLAMEARRSALRFDEDLLADVPAEPMLLSADTPLVSRSPWLSSGAVRMSGEMFADGQARVVVSASVPDEVFDSIRESVDRAQRVARAAEQVGRLLADMQLQLLPWQRTVLERAFAGDDIAFTVSNRRAGRRHNHENGSER
ncbi:hypothetical protein [uncultured Microbacterium sp.]|uniref:hypothetical protein n=1 Tax=uncultured Microbacterium sp. TaxID=191216 RepID=UPI002600377E|nr:hypothetical protein [uncultured Microbacterium sp.]